MSLDKALAKYLEYISGDSPASRWFFIATTSFIFSAMTFLTFNYGDNDFINILGVQIPFNNERILLFIPKSFFGQKIDAQFKIVEFIFIWIIMSGIVSISYGNIIKNRLRDAMSSLRDELYGSWTLTLSGIIKKQDPNVETIINIGIKIGKTKAEKLLITYESSPLIAINGHTAHVALVVNDADNSKVEISFPISSTITAEEEETVTAFLYVTLWYANIGGGNTQNFTGHWYLITDIKGYRPTGTCIFKKNTNPQLN